MVSPQLRRQAVVVMRSEVAVSERRACGLMQRSIAGPIATRHGPRIRDCACGCASWRQSGEGSDIAD